MEKNSKKNEKLVAPRTVIMAFLLLALIYLIVIGAMLYFFTLTGKINSNKIVRKTAGVIPYPAAVVGRDMVTFDTLATELEGVKNFYERQDYSQFGLRVDFSTEEGKKRLRLKEKEILTKLIQDKIIEAESRKRGIKITDDIVDQEVDRKMKEYGTGDFLKENMERLYGWNVETFKRHIVRPDLYRERLTADLTKSDKDYSKDQEKIKAAMAELEKDEKFSEVAKKYSEGDTASEGGDLGWFKISQMTPEVGQEVLELEKGGRSGIVRSSLGFHIIFLEDRKTEDDEEMYKVSQIFVRTKSFPEWLLESAKAYKVILPIREFRWNGEDGLVEFRDERMRSFEEALEKNPASDPSVIF